ncbi:alpha/beta-hydrolase [Rickenella mellea]|uniref:Alpha/beta-hydrolase n=1 Tax=Rickenella mellea TaxID=50990 RepID=A0A4Y7PKW3_9AGAM|nr:alpha/beta-hydrolase [Rickenella mellea]
MSNSLTRTAGLRVGPLVLETLIKHYFDQLVKSKSKSKHVPLRQEELLYDEAFTIVKTFLEASSRHTVEELQRFSNARTPSPPWIRVVRVTIPMSCCNDAAEHLIKALGGEEVAKRVVGGTKWWQVRGVKGVDAQWMAVRKDYEKAKKRYKEQQRQKELNGQREGTPTDNGSEEADPDQLDPDPCYNAEMDEMRCILYAHGGGYYFGSVDQERYCMQRFARKINGRLLGVSYRLAPQYPFPCAIQDLLAAYLFLIRPPSGALHMPVKPAHIIVAGDSAGGGLTLALLQVIRDSNLPMPAGAVLISPWCDLTHSFPSIHINTATDVIPPYGLSLHKPSGLWPPPSEEMTHHVRETLRSRISKIAGRYGVGHGDDTSSVSDSENGKPEGIKPRSSSSFLRARRNSKASTSTAAVAADVLSEAPHLSNVGNAIPEALGTTAPLPSADSKDQTIQFTTASGETIVIKQQIQLYTTNNLLVHPLVSPALSYLGGLPPLFIIASEKEVLRDEGIYAAHKAAHPDKYPVKKETKKMYPALEDIENCYGPTKVHLQVYDDTAHVLPILFPFTQPAKFCFRAIATFCKYATGMLPTSNQPTPQSSIMPRSPTIPRSPAATRPSSMIHRASHFIGRKSTVSHANGSGSSSNIERDRDVSSDDVSTPDAEDSLRPNGDLHRSASFQHRQPFNRRDSKGTRPMSLVFTNPLKNRAALNDPDQSYSPRDMNGTPPPSSRISYGFPSEIGMAGNPAVYASHNGSSPFIDFMIRERVSTKGFLRALEPESELQACNVPPELIGVVSELAARRYLKGRAIFDKKFEGTAKSVAKSRARNLELADKDAARNLSQLQMHFFKDAYERDRKPGKPANAEKSIKSGLTPSSSWSWAWAIEGDEQPPPSSIVSRRDTEEARRLSKIADQPTNAEDEHMSGNSLWSFLVTSLSPADKDPNSRMEVKEVNTTQPRSPAKLKRFSSVMRTPSPAQLPQTP